MLVYSPSKRTGVYLASNEHHHIHLFLLLLLDIIEELSSVLSQLPVGEREREREGEKEETLHLFNLFQVLVTHSREVNPTPL